MTQKISIGLIGLGEMGLAHLACLQGFPQVTITALCDTNPDHLGVALNLTGGKGRTFTDFRALLEQDDIDAVFVSLPNHLHAPVGLAVLETDKHLFLEKPLATRVGDGKKLLQASRKVKRHFQVGHEYRFSPFYIEMSQWLESGCVGRPLLLWCHEFREPFPQRDWFYDQSKTGGTFVEKNCHHFDLFNWMAGDAPARVVAFGGQGVLKPGTMIACSYSVDPPKKMAHNDTLDHGWVIVEYRKGAKASLGLCMFLEPPERIWRGLELGVIGDSGKMLVSNVDLETMTLYGGSKKEETRTIKNPFQGKWHSGMREEHEAFLESMAQDRPRLDTVQSAFDAIGIALAAEESVSKRKIISMTSSPP